MKGDERVRFCPQCQLNVYNFSELSTTEISQLISLREGRLCARFYKRSDGTMLTKNCQTGLGGLAFRAARISGAALTALMSLAPAVRASVTEDKNVPLTQIQVAQAMLVIEVADKFGAVIRDAEITIVNESSHHAVEARTDSTGRVHIPDLPDGSYEISVRANGFSPSRQVHVAIPASGVLAFQLSIAALMGEVVVIEEPETKSELPSLLPETRSTKADSARVLPEQKNILRKLLSSLRWLF